MFPQQKKNPFDYQGELFTISREQRYHDYVQQKKPQKQFNQPPKSNDTSQIGVFIERYKFWASQGTIQKDITQGEFIDTMQSHDKILKKYFKLSPSLKDQLLQGPQELLDQTEQLNLDLISNTNKVKNESIKIIEKELLNQNNKEWQYRVDQLRDILSIFKHQWVDALDQVIAKKKKIINSHNTGTLQKNLQQFTEEFKLQCYKIEQTLEDQLDDEYNGKLKTEELKSIDMAAWEQAFIVYLMDQTQIMTSKFEIILDKLVGQLENSVNQIRKQLLLFDSQKIQGYELQFRKDKEQLINQTMEISGMEECSIEEQQLLRQILQANQPMYSQTEYNTMFNDSVNRLLSSLKEIPDLEPLPFESISTIYDMNSKQESLQKYIQRMDNFFRVYIKNAKQYLITLPISKINGQPISPIHPTKTFSFKNLDTDKQEHQVIAGELLFLRRDFMDEDEILINCSRVLKKKQKSIYGSTYKSDQNDNSKEMINGLVSHITAKLINKKHVQHNYVQFMHFLHDLINDQTGQPYHIINCRRRDGKNFKGQYEGFCKYKWFDLDQMKIYNLTISGKSHQTNYALGGVGNKRRLNIHVQYQVTEFVYVFPSQVEFKFLNQLFHNGKKNI